MVLVFCELVSFRGDPAALAWAPERQSWPLLFRSVAQSCLTLATPWTTACQASLSSTISRSLLKLISIESVMPSTISSSAVPFSSCPQSFPSIRVFPSESALHIRWPKYWSYSFSISPSSEYSGLISFRMDWFELAVAALILGLMATTRNVLCSFCCRCLCRGHKPANQGRSTAMPGGELGSLQALCCKPRGRKTTVCMNGRPVSGLSYCLEVTKYCHISFLLLRRIPT